MAEYQAERVPVSPVRVATTTVDETLAFINATYVGARIRLSGRGDDFRHELTGFATPSLQVASYRYTRGLSLDIDPFEYLMAVVVTGGNAEVRAKREQAAGGGDAVFLLYPPISQLRVSWGDDFAARLFAMPLERVQRLADEQAGVARADLRFTSMRPVSAAMSRLWRKTMHFTASQLAGPHPAAASPLVEQAIAAMAVAAALAVFPNTTLSTGYLPGPGWAGPAALRRAVAFIDGHAHEPVTMTQLAEASGASGRALRHAFTRQYSVTPSGYLRRVRLERAHEELRAANPGQEVTVAGIARTWGWASPSQFAADYRAAYGVTPSHTLRG